MSFLVLVAFWSYLGSLFVATTVYSERFLMVRWLCLAGLAVLSGIHWLSTLRDPRCRLRDRTKGHLATYLILTLLTVFGAASSLFSGLRWSTHALMLIVLMVFLRESFQFRELRWIVPGLKLMTFSMVFYSVFRGVTRGSIGTTIYHGVTGDANSLGHVAAVGGILFLHGWLGASEQRRRTLEGLAATNCIAVVWLTGARSSMVSFMVGTALLLYFYRRLLHRRFVAVIATVGVCALVWPQLPQMALRFVVKDDRGSVHSVERIFDSRVPVWLEAWEGFKSRPWLGWGFGADSTVAEDWEIQPTALGTVQRDAVNDSLFMLEGCGLIGLLAYLILVAGVLHQRPTQQQLSWLRWFQPRQRGSRNAMFALHHHHVLLYTLALSLLVLVQFDATALSAGNFISALVWVGAGSAGALRRQWLFVSRQAHESSRGLAPGLVSTRWAEARR